MTYLRVIPRDLFNEADLLKCLGKLWIALDNDRGHQAELENDGGRFEIVQSDADGSIEVANVDFRVRGLRYRLWRPLNARGVMPLWLSIEGDDIRVFDLDGNLSAEFMLFVGEQK